ncbi:MAG TPA: ATP-binding protein [Candidatus Ozemobacteraceae bacterium]|nr:ATP-binding protein [Candidatus Ozemobacteraceae bacterium]
MNWFPPRRLQSALIFYVAGIILFTNSFFAITTISRENLTYLADATSSALFLGRIMQPAAYRFLEEGDTSELERIASARQKERDDIYITIYDSHWWRRWGDPARITSQGFPPVEGLKDGLITSGAEGMTIREIFLPVASGGRVLGSIGLGVPDFGARDSRDAAFQVFLTMGVNVCLGLILAVFIAQIVLRPLNQVIEGLQAIRHGDFDQRLHVIGGTEMTMVGETFNMMASSLQEKIRENLERTRALDEKVQELWEIYAFAKNIGFSLDINDVLHGFLERAVTLSYSSYGQILLRTPPTGHLVVRVETPSLPLIRQAEYDAFLARCLEGGETIQERLPQHTLLALPLVSGRVIQGVLFLAKQGGQPFSEGVRRFLETLAPLGGTLIENAQLYRDVLEMKEYVRNVLDSVDSGVATFDEAGNLVTYNAGFSRILGVQQESGRHGHWKQVIDAAGDPAFSGALQPAMSEAFDRSKVEQEAGYGMTPWSQITLNRPGTDSRELQVRVNPLMAGASEIGRVLVLDDVTEMKQLERRAFDIEKWAVLGRLAASVAHEIRNPLVAVRSLVEIIGEEVRGESLEHVRVVLGEVHRLNKVVEQLLHFARPEKAVLQNADLKEVCEEVFILIRHEAAKHRVGIVSNWPGTPACATIDREKIKQALLNVMLNAIQAMEGGGTLTVGIRTGNEMVGIEVKDTGRGIPGEVMRHVFDPFFTTRKQGTGLGLSITRKIVDLHQGRIRFESAPDVGTVCVIEIPVSPARTGYTPEPRDE